MSSRCCHPMFALSYFPRLLPTPDLGCHPPGFLFVCYSPVSRAAPSLARPRGFPLSCQPSQACLLRPWLGIRAAVSSLPPASVPAGVANRKPRSGRRGMARLELRLGGEPPFAVGTALLTPHNSAKPL